MAPATSVLTRTLLRAFDAEMKDRSHSHVSRLCDRETKEMIKDLLRYIDTGTLPALPRWDYRAVMGTAPRRECLQYLHDRRNGLSRPQLDELREFIERSKHLLPDDSENMRRAIEIDLLPKTISSRYVH